MSGKLPELSEKLLEAARKAGAESADAILVNGTSVSVEVREGGLEHAERAEGIDLGLRVLIGHRQACVSVSDISENSIKQMAERAVAMAREAPEDPSCGLADPDQLAIDWDAGPLDLFDPGDRPQPAVLQELANEAEAAALAVAGISQAEGAGAGYSDSQIFLATSNGFRGGYRKSGFSISCSAITGEGTEMERDYCGESRNHFADLPSARDIGMLAGERAVARSGAKKPPTGAYPVIFDERISSSLIGHLLAAVNGTAIVRGASWLKDALGEDVLPKGLSLIENPLRARTAGSKPFDAEGLPVEQREIVNKGVLNSWTLDLGTARKLDMTSTGNASRGVSSPPSPSSGNMWLTSGEKSRDELAKDMGTGLIVTGMIGSTINPTTGDYSRGASGLWVENGQVTGPVNECTVAGNLRDMLMTLTPANDARQHLSRVVPSLLVEGLTIAGA